MASFIEIALSNKELCCRAKWALTDGKRTHGQPDVPPDDVMPPRLIALAAEVYKKIADSRSDDVVQQAAKVEPVFYVATESYTPCTKSSQELSVVVGDIIQVLYISC